MSLQLAGSPRCHSAARLAEQLYEKLAGWWRRTCLLLFLPAARESNRWRLSWLLFGPFYSCPVGGRWWKLERIAFFRSVSSGLNYWSF